MNKIRNFAMIFAFMLVLVACGDKETKAVYSTTVNGVELKFTFFSKGDEVVRQTANNKIPYSTIQASNKEDAKAKLAPIAALFQGVEGVTESIEYFDDYALETLDINYAKADISKISKLPGSTFDGDIKSGKKVSLKTTTEMLEKQGFKKVE